MAIHGHIVKGVELLIHEKKIGWVRAWATEEPEGIGGSALFRVEVNSVNLPGIGEAVINVNFWDVYRFDDVEALKKIALEHVKVAISR